jgi:pyruvate/2-oxoglutarate dehydrogenase complex dihydrolipoamide dehydrogenase (E3) component
MPKVAQKFTDIVIVGKSDSAQLIKMILTYQNKKTYKHFTTSIPRFVSANTMVLDGDKISAKKFVVILPELQKAKAFTVVGSHPLIINPDAQFIDGLAKSWCVIGSDTYAVMRCVDLSVIGSKITLISEGTFLPAFDMTVQDIVERYIKKIGITLLKDSPVLSIEPSKDTAHIITDYNGTPRRISVNQLIITPDSYYSTDIGLGNVGEISEQDSVRAIFQVGSDVLIVKDNPQLGLAMIYKITDFLLGNKSHGLDYKPRTIYTSPKLSFFSIGISEQDYFDTHLSYKKCIVKVKGPEKSPVNWFIKVLASAQNKIIGIHAVLPFSYQNTDLLISLVENDQPISELRNSCLVNDELAEAFVEIIGSMT